MVAGDQGVGRGSLPLSLQVQAKVQVDHGGGGVW